MERKSKHAEGVGPGQWRRSPQVSNQVLAAAQLGWWTCLGQSEKTDGGFDWGADTSKMFDQQQMLASEEQEESLCIKTLQCWCSPRLEFPPRTRGGGAAGGQTAWGWEEEWGGGGRDGPKTKGGCHVCPQSLIDVMRRPARRQRFR